MSKQMSGLEDKFIRDMRKVVKVCFELSEDYSMQRLSGMADLHVTTLTRLWNEQTTFPRFMTVQKLCRAVGLEVTWSPEHKKTTLKLVA